MIEAPFQAETKASRHSTLIFSIALNGYQWRYFKHLASHRAYAQKHDYHYEVVTKPFYSPMGINCCWLKLTLMYTALRAGYQQVMFVDADAYINDNCPPLNTMFVPEKSIYMAKGYSHRFNSGVMIIRNCLQARNWLKRIITHRHDKVEPQHDVGWGENSHVISHSEGCRFIKEIPQEWNNTSSYCLTDFIRHHNYGPLRSGSFERATHYLMFVLANKIAKLQRLFTKKPKTSRRDDLLFEQTQKTLHNFPNFCHRAIIESPQDTSSSLNSRLAK